MNILIFTTVVTSAYCLNNEHADDIALHSQKSLDTVDNLFGTENVYDHQLYDSSSQLYNTVDNYVNLNSGFPVPEIHQSNDRSINKLNLNVNLFVKEPYYNAEVPAPFNEFSNGLDNPEMNSRYLHRPNIYLTNSGPYPYLRIPTFPLIVQPPISSVSTYVQNDVNSQNSTESNNLEQFNTKSDKYSTLYIQNDDRKESNSNSLNSMIQSNQSVNLITTEVLNQLTDAISTKLLQNITADLTKISNDSEKFHEKDYNSTSDFASTKQEHYDIIKDGFKKMLEEYSKTEQEFIVLQVKKLKEDILETVLEKEKKSKEITNLYHVNDQEIKKKIKEIEKDKKEEEKETVLSEEMGKKIQKEEENEKELAEEIRKKLKNKEIEKEKSFSEEEMKKKNEATVQNWNKMQEEEKALEPDKIRMNTRRVKEGEEKQKYLDQLTMNILHGRQGQRNRYFKK